MFDLEITRLGLDQAVKFFTPFFSSSSSPTPFSPSFSNLGSLYTSPPLLPFPSPQSRIDSRATGSRVVPPYPAFSHLRSRDYLPRWTFSSYATGNFILRDNTCFAIRFRPDDLLFLFFFYLFGSETYVKLILDQMVSTTKSTRFVSCDCSRQIHHARLLPFILFIERFSKDRSRSRVHRRNHPLREKEKKGKEIYLPLLHLYLLFRKTILTFYTSSERIGEKEGTAGSCSRGEKKAEKGSCFN